MKKRLLIGCLILLSIPVIVSSQTDIHPIVNATLNGIVIDQNSKTPLAGAVVKLKGTTQELIADEKGRFNFVTGQKLPLIAIVTHVGYQTLETEINSSEIE